MNYYSNKFEKSVEGKLKNFLVQDGAEISAQQNAIWRARTSKYSAIFYNTGKFLIQGSDVSEISKKVEEFRLRHLMCAQGKIFLKMFR